MYLRWPAVAAMAAVCLVVFVVPSTQLVLVWFVVVALLASLDVLLAPRPSSLQFERRQPDGVRLGEETVSHLVVTNPTSRTFRGAVRDVWSPGAGAQDDRSVLNLAPGASVDHVVHLLPTRRGMRPNDAITVRSAGPLRLAGRQTRLDEPGLVRVLPAFSSRAHLPSRLVQLREIEGRSLVRAPGSGSEFDSLRDYVRGDDIRSIDWRATARRRAPVVRTWRPERDRRVSILLDTGRLSAGRLADTTRLDAGMEACLLLAALAGHAGDNVEWTAGDRAVLAHVPPTSGRNEAVRRMMLAMAPLESRLVEPDWSRLVQEATADARRGSLLVIVTPFEPAAIEESLVPLLPALARETRVVIASVADPEVGAIAAKRDNVRDVYGAAAAERLRHRTTTMRAALERHGISVLHEPPERLAPALADHYLVLKREGRL